jgi:hypothetical protein
MTDCEPAPPKVDPDAIDALIDWALTRTLVPLWSRRRSRIRREAWKRYFYPSPSWRCTSRSRAMATPRIAVEVVFPLKDYTEPQLILACAIQQALERGKLVLTERPWKA